MTKTPSRPVPLPAELMPAKSSTQLVNEHVQRFLDGGGLQKAIAASLGFNPNYVSQLKEGVDLLPLPRIMAFAAAVHLSDEERSELLHARLMELHGEKGAICVETLAQWAVDLVAPIGDEARLIEMWREATCPAPYLLGGLLNDPTRAARIAAVMNDVVQAELQALADEVAMP